MNTIVEQLESILGDLDRLRWDVERARGDDDLLHIMLAERELRLVLDSEKEEG